MIRLIKNEFIKEYTTKRIIITIILFILVSLITYMYCIYIPKISEYINYMPNNESNIEEYYNRILDIYEDDPSANNLYSLKEWTRIYENDKLTHDYHIVYGDWRYEALSKLSEYNRILSILDVLKEGYELKDFYNDNTYDYLSNTNIEEEYNMYLNEYELVINTIKNNLYVEFSKIMKMSIEKNIKLVENDDEQSKKDYLNEELDKYTFIINKNIENIDDYRLKEFYHLKDLKDLNNFTILSEKEFNSGGLLILKFRDYNEYLEYSTNKKEYLDNEIKEMNYTIEKDIKNYSNDYKNILNYTLYFFIIIGIFVIVRSSNTISDEFNDGSIKLLLSSGIKRSKILFSKFLNVILDTYIYYFVFVIIFILVGLLFFNINDLFIPNISIINNNIILSNYILDLIKNILLVSLPIILLSTLSLLLSIITWNNIISISTNVFILLTSSTYLNTFKSYHIEGLLQYTPAPYLDMTKFMHINNPIDFNNLNFITSTYNIDKGLIVLIVWIIIIYILNNIIFIKRDISKY